MSMMVSFVLSFFPRDVLDEILNLIESVSEDFPSYSLLLNKMIDSLVMYLSAARDYSFLRDRMCIFTQTGFHVANFSFVFSKAVIS